LGAREHRYRGGHDHFSVRRGDVTLPNTAPAAGAARDPWSGEGTMMGTAVTLLDRKWPRLQRDGDVLFCARTVGAATNARWMA